MQKLTYINLRNEQIIFQGAPYVLGKITGLGIPDIEVATLRGAYQQGDTIIGYRRGARTVTVAFTLMCASRSALYAARSHLLAILSADRAVSDTDRATLIYENDYGRWMTPAMPMEGMMPDARIENAQTGLKIEFRCESPFFYSTVALETSFSYTDSGLELPFAFPFTLGSREFSKEVTNPGQVATPVELWIACKGETPQIVNRSTGKSLALAAPIPDGYTLYLNTDYAKLSAQLIQPDGTRIGAFGKLSLDTPLADFVLRPGINVLEYRPSGGTMQSVITIRWRSAYEGV